jgi:hypothetical protein
MTDFAWYLPCCLVLAGLFWLAGWALPEALFGPRRHSRAERASIAIAFGGLLLPLPLYFLWHVLPAGVALLLAVVVCAGGGWLLRRWSGTNSLLQRRDIAAEAAPTNPALPSPPSLTIALLSLALLWALMEGTLLLQVGERHQCALTDYPKHFALSWSLGHYGLPLKNPWWAVGGAPRQGSYYLLSYLPHSALWSALGGRGPALSAWLAARAAMGCISFIVLVLLAAQVCGASGVGLWIALMMATWAGGIRIVWLALLHRSDLVYFAWPIGPPVDNWSSLFHWTFQHVVGLAICVAALVAASQPTKAKLIVVPVLLAALVGTSAVLALMVLAPFTLCLVLLPWEDAGAGSRPAPTEAGHTSDPRVGQEGGRAGRAASRLRTWALPLILAVLLCGVVALQYRMPGSDRSLPLGFRGWLPFFTRLEPMLHETHVPRILIPALRLFSPFVWGLMIFGLPFVTALYGLWLARRERLRLPALLQAVTILAGLSFVFSQILCSTTHTEELFRRGIMPYCLGVLLWGVLGAQWALERWRAAQRGKRRGLLLHAIGAGCAALLLLGAVTTGWELYHYGLRTPCAYGSRNVYMPSAQVAAWRFVRHHTPSQAHVLANMEPWGPSLAQYYCQRQLVLGGVMGEPLVFTRDTAGLQHDHDWLHKVAREAPTEELARVLRQVGADYVVLGRDEVWTIEGSPGKPPLTVPYWGNMDRFRDPRFFAVEYETGRFLVVKVKGG